MAPKGWQHTEDMKGHKRTPESKEKTRQSVLRHFKEHPVSDSTRQKMSISQKRNKWHNVSDEGRRKISEAGKKAKGGQHALGHHWHLSDATKEKMRQSHLGKSNSRLGTHHSEATKKKISDAMKDKHWHLSLETRRKMSVAKKGCVPWNKGLTKETDSRVEAHPCSSETRKKLSDANKGKHLSPETEFKKGHIVSDETIKKAREATKGHPGYWLGRHHSDESNEKNRIAHMNKPSGMLGKHPSAETRRKMSDAQKRKHRLKEDSSSSP